MQGEIDRLGISLRKNHASFGQIPLTRLTRLVKRGAKSPMYAKLFQQVLTSSLTENEPVDVRGVFFMLMAAADRAGNVLGSDATIARIINVPMDQFKRCLEALMKPDPQSRSLEYEGRRVIPLERGLGYLLPSYVKYSGTMTDEQRREYFRIKQAECRARKKEAETAGITAGNAATQSNHHAGKFVPPTEDEVMLLASKIGLPEIEGRKFFNYWDEQGWKNKGGPVKDLTKRMVRWKLNWESAGRPMPPAVKKPAVAI